MGCQSMTGDKSESAMQVVSIDQIEDGAKLRFAVEEEAYGEDIVALWDKTYPQHKGAISYGVTTAPQIYQKYMDSRTFGYDVVWGKDTYLFSFAQHSYTMDTNFLQSVEVTVPDCYYENVQSLYVPMRAEGMIFAYKEEKLQALGLDASIMESFEKMIALNQEKVYFHMNYAYHVDPLLTSSFLLFQNGTDAGFDSKEFKNSLQVYKQLYQDLKLYDAATNMNDYFTTNEYVSGLVGTWMNFDGQGMHFQKMPTYQGRQFTPTANSYGYFIKKDTAYPNAAKALLRLMRSKEGMQAYIKSSYVFPLLDENMLEKFTFQNENQKEISRALQYSRPQQVWGQYHNPTTNVLDIYFKTNILDQIQKYINEEVQLKDTLHGIIKQQSQYMLLDRK